MNSWSQGRSATGGPAEAGFYVDNRQLTTDNAHAEVMPARAVPLRTGTGVAFLRRRTNSSGAAPARSITPRIKARNLKARAIGRTLVARFSNSVREGLVRTTFAIPTAFLLLVLGGCRT